MSRIDNYDWRKINKIRRQLAEMGAIALFWNVEDIQNADEALSDKDAWKILQMVEDGWDAERGVSWDVVRMFIDEFKENQNE